jgi:hypothetical protein
LRLVGLDVVDVEPVDVDVDPVDAVEFVPIALNPPTPPPPLDVAPSTNRRYPKLVECGLNDPRQADGSYGS